MSIAVFVRTVFIEGINPSQLVHSSMAHKEYRTVNLSRLGSTINAESSIDKLMRTALSRPELLSLAAGFTDNRRLPLELIEELQKKLHTREGLPEYLQYGMNQGRPRLRQAISAFLGRHYTGETAPDPDSMFITNGSQQALYLATLALCDPGDIIFVEAPSYFVYLEALKGIGVQPRSIPTTAAGNIDFAAFQALLRQMQSDGSICKVKAVYLVTYYANPSARCVPEADKIRLGALLAELDTTVAVIEDAAYRELYFEEPWPANGLPSLDSFRNVPHIYAGTFTKPFATGIKVGFACCSDDRWLQTILRFKAHQDFGTSNYLQALLETLLVEGLYEDHLLTLRQHYQRKMLALHNTLKENKLDSLGWSWEHAGGGLLMWLHGPDEIETGLDSAIYHRCLDENVIYVPGELCFAEGTPKNCIRLSFGAIDLKDIPEAAVRFVRGVSVAG